jgi:hypothetical protein
MLLETKLEMNSNNGKKGMKTYNLESIVKTYNLESIVKTYNLESIRDCAKDLLRILNRLGLIRNSD